MLNVPTSVLTHAPAAAGHVSTDILVIGAGAAGLAAALSAARSARVLVLARAALPESNSAWAQGGIAAALDSADSPADHVADTLIAGAGLCDPPAVSTLAAEAPALMYELAANGVPFERSDPVHFALGLEGGHSRRRIVHVGDATGWAVTRNLIEQARANPNITIWECTQAVDLLSAEGRVIGALVRNDNGAWHRIYAGAVIMASGGAGALYGLTSNQPTALGEGIALAYRAGAALADMEFVQFHPTVYRTKAGQGFLITEAARGEGGILRTLDGERFMPAYDRRAELAPRDIVTRGIYAAMRRSGSDHVLLDLTHLAPEVIESHFPTICARLRADGIDPLYEPIPVAPASHYLMGGIRTDLDGATNIPGLFAAGEVTCTGVHGANRLASNSLLECLVFGRRAGIAAAQRMQASAYTGTYVSSAYVQPVPGDEYTMPNLNWRSELATIMVASAGPLRDGDGLRRGLGQLSDWPLQASPDSPDEITAANAALTARLIMQAALLREESRGGHFRSDFPQPQDRWQVHTVLQRTQPVRYIATIVETAELAHAAD